MRWSAIAKLPGGWRFTTEPLPFELRIITWAFQYFLGNIDPLSQNCTTFALDQRHWQCATGTPVIECPFFSYGTSRLPAAALETCLWGPRLGTATSWGWPARQQSWDVCWRLQAFIMCMNGGDMILRGHPEYTSGLKKEIPACWSALKSTALCRSIRGAGCA